MKLFHTALVLGKGGFGTQLGEMLAEAGGYSRILYLDDQAPDAAGKLADYLDPTIRERCTAAFVGLGNNELRLQWLQKLVAAGYQTPVFEHPAAEVCSSAALGAGTVVLPFAFVGAETKVGAGCIINAGAIVLADILLKHLPHPEEDFLHFIRNICGNDTINYNEEVAVSEREKGYLNAAIANLLKYHHNIENDIERVLHFYFLQCSVEMSCYDLSKAFLAFANHKQPFTFGDINLTASQVKRINAIMQTCGFYDEAGEFSYLVGLPGKSGVGGGIAAVYPLRYSVAVWSPRLNRKGNSVMGIKALELLTTQTQESIF